MDIYSRFKMHFPLYEEHVVDYRQHGEFELILNLDDGMILSYYDFDNSIRQIPQVEDPYSAEYYSSMFGVRLYRIMNERGITQSVLSDMTGISQRTISCYITGKVAPSFRNVDKITKALGCSMDDLRY